MSLSKPGQGWEQGSCVEQYHALRHIHAHPNTHTRTHTEGPDYVSGGWAEPAGLEEHGQQRFLLATGLLADSPSGPTNTHVHVFLSPSHTRTRTHTHTHTLLFTDVPESRRSFHAGRTGVLGEGGTGAVPAPVGHVNTSTEGQQPHSFNMNAFPR